MNEITQNSLSFDSVKLDYNALIQTATFAYVQLKETARRRLAELDHAAEQGSNTALSLQSQWLAETAKQLAIAADTLSALKEGKKRLNKKLVNIPEVKDLS